MQATYWQSRWQEGKIGFHQPQVNPQLVQHLPALALTAGDRIFVPLCGKSLDIGWLARQGYDVVGAELSEEAVQALFFELHVTPSIVQQGDLTHYQAIYAERTIDIWVGDIFDLTRTYIGHVDAIYDRAALVALSDSAPDYLRTRYSKHLIYLTYAATQLLITFDIDQSLRPAPPFVVTPKQLQDYYQDDYQLTLLEDTYSDAVLSDGTAGRFLVWLLTN